MALKPYEEVSPEPLSFQIRGNTYTLPEVGVTDGARIEAGEDIADEDLLLMLLGDARDQMRADNVPAEAFSRAFMAALADTRVSRAAAELVWETGAVPERIAATVTAASQLTDSPNTTDSASESADETPSPASTRSTTSPSGTRRNAATKRQPAKAAASRGRKSSPNGASS